MRILLLIACLAVLAFAVVKSIPMLASAPEANSVEAMLFVSGGDPVAIEMEQFLRERGVRVRIYDVNADALAKAEFVRQGGGQLPLAVIQGDRVDGYRPWELERVIARRTSR